MGNRYFGTDGFRGQYGVVLCDVHAYKIGRFLGCYGDRKNKILLARDTRFSGESLSKSLSGGILSSGGAVADLGVSSTPSLSYLLSRGGFDYGVIISASHNPYQDNGIKVFNAHGEKLSNAIENEIEAYLDGEADSLPNQEGSLLPSDGLLDRYLDYLESLASKNLQHVHALFDCANGSASALAPKLFARLGLNCDFIHNTPDGRNINENCGSTHLESLLEEMKRGGYEIGFAFDGDADRLMAVRRDGRILDGDCQIYLAALSSKKNGTLGHEKVVLTQMANFGLTRALEKEGIGYEKVDVGDKYVHAKLKSEGWSIGGEQSGHVIFLKELNTGDGMLSAIHVLNVYADEPDVFARLDEFEVYPQKLVNVRFASREEAKEAMNGPRLKEAIEEVLASLKGEGRVLVRPSGTEPLLRLMVEAKTIEKCDEAIAKLQAAL